MFNYFKEIKEKFKIPDSVLQTYNIINIGGKFVYIEGHKGLLKLSDSLISFKLKKGYIEIRGNCLKLKRLSLDVVAIQGKISKIEVF